ncbi:S49 family peptidase [Mesobaculum littorinae]|uniref:S49 family peptidase n=1 Tax=Mesobaculum littorinae TaxID=2486419 RepID=A0A438AM26_9RHOB|nr:S49 family peptidase [Mesobaculum littorinae]RVV99710.1 S49 family peptidase [Mesobaculum littorinae]
MTRRTVASMLAGSTVALCHPAAGEYLATELPEAAAGGPVAIERGERFAVSGGVAVMPIRGLMTPNSELLERYLGWATYRGIEEAMTELTEREDVAAIALELDTPGGLVRNLDAAAEAVAAAAAVKPVHALVSPLAASAGYRLAAHATEIVMTAGSEVGSIGVAVMAHRPEAPDMGGERWFEFTSRHARAKRPDPGTPEGIAVIRADLDRLEATFHAAVAAGRGIPLEDLPARLSLTDDPADGGGVFHPAEAIARGLADRQSRRSDFYSALFAAHAPRRQTAPRAYRARAAAARALATT